MEEALVDLWAQVLGVEQVGIHDNFFELGGHSLLATQLMARARAMFGVELALRTLFESPTVAGLAEEVEAALRAGAGVEMPALGPVPRDGELALSFAQQRLWFLDQLEPHSPFYNLLGAVWLRGALAVEALEGALSEIVRRHEALRTTFPAVEGRPRQVIGASRPLPLPVVEVDRPTAEAREAEARQLAAAELRRPFDLERGPLVRACLLRLGADEHVLVLSLHHIVADGWSMGVLVRELVALYDALRHGRPSPLAELPLQYADYAAWQRTWLTGEVLEAQLGYWREQLDGAPALLELPTDRPRPPVQSYRGGRRRFRLPAPLLTRLKALSRQEGVTLFMTLLAAFNVLLQRYSGQDDIVVGSPIAGRTRVETEGLIGFFVNTLALRTDLSGDPPFAELLGRVREAALGAYAHQDLPFEKLVEELGPDRSLSHSPLFQVMFQLHNVPGEDLALPELSVAPLTVEADTAKFDLTLGAVESGGELIGALEYSTDLWDEATIERMTGHWQALLASAADDPRRRLSELNMLSEPERRQLLGGGNPPTAPAPDICIHQLFEAQAARTPDAVAVAGDGRELTYRQLDRRANRLAHHLRSLGVGPEVLVGICVERSPEMVIGLLAILKAGGAYVPLDPSHPPERLAFMAADAAISVVVSTEHLQAAIPASAGAVVTLDGQATVSAPDDSPPNKTTPANTAYVLYTSGSTGRPKGVDITHGNAVAFLRWACSIFPPGDLAGVLASSSICFDLSAFELLAPLSWGGAIMSGRQRSRAYRPPACSPGDASSTPCRSAMAALLRQGGLPVSVQTVNLAGELLPKELVQAVYAQKVPAGSQPVWAHRSHHLFHLGRRAGRRGWRLSSYRPSGGQYAGLCAGFALAAGSDRRGGRAVHRWGWSGSGVPAPS